MKQRNNEKGFTLVELLIAVAIAALVATAIFAFMVVGARSFNATSSDINVQYESQLVFNQMQDLLVDTNIGVDYQYATAAGDIDSIADGDFTTLPETDTDDDIPASATFKRMVMYNYDPDDTEKHVYEVTWDKTAEKVYYSEYEPSKTTEADGDHVSKGAEVPGRTKQLMGEHFTSFAVDLNDMEAKRIIRVDLTFEKNDKEYKSSHNITLRNKIARGSTIPSYIEKVEKEDPMKVTGPENVYLEPGDTLDLAHYDGGYSVLAPDGSLYADQQIRFYIDNSVTPATGTSVSTDGKITVSKGQKSDFYISVLPRSGKGTPCKVHVNLIIVTGINITFAQDSEAKDEVQNGKYDDDLVQNEKFTLTAVVSGRNLDKAKTDVYKVRWEVPEASEKFVTIGSSTDTADGSVCTFTMKGDFTIPSGTEQVAFSIFAFSVRSEDVPYMNSSLTVTDPVYAEFILNAYGKKGHFPAGAMGGLQRGMRLPDRAYGYAMLDEMFKAGGILAGQNADEWKKNHSMLVDVHVYELRYEQDENSPSTTMVSKREVNYTTQSSDTRLCSIVGDGNHVVPCAPHVNNSSPNVEYEYDVTYYVFPLDGTNIYTGDIRIIANEHNDSPHVKDLSKAEYWSDTAKMTGNRAYIYYDSNDDRKGPEYEYKWVTTQYQWYSTTEYKRVGIKTPENTWTKNSVYEWYPRLSVNAAPSNMDSWVSLQASYSVSQPTDMLQNISSGGMQGYSYYKQVDGSWVKFDSDNRKLDKNTIEKYVKVDHSNSYARFQLYYNNWKEGSMGTTDNFSLPMTIRAVPEYKYYEYETKDSQPEEKTELMFDDYAEIKLWNIVVPTVKNDNALRMRYTQATTVDGYQVVSGSGYYNHLYFPVPSDPLPSDARTYDGYYNVSDKTKGEPDKDRKSWSKPYPNNNTSSPRYTLSKNRDGNGAYYYTLKLFYSTGGSWKPLADYTCYETDKAWTMTQKYINQ